jgi:hypothetical protein
MIEALNGLKYTFHLVFHPFDGFWDLKHEKRGNIKAALVIIAMLCVMAILRRQLTGFIFNINDLLELNIFIEIASILLPFALWCVSNWCFTSLMEGEGSFKDIVITTAFALAPLIIINIPLILLSNIITMPEGAFYNFFNSLSIIWSGILLILGTMVVHQYTLLRTIFTSVLIVVGMAVIIFIGLLFFSMLQQMYAFVYTVYLEISLRM